MKTLKLIFSIFVSKLKKFIMVSQITNGIKVTVRNSYEGTYFRNYNLNYAFSYRITIENQSNDSAQLLTRHWRILDSLNFPENVDGEGVVGKKPILKPGESYSYESSCLLNSPYGAMKGFFSMINFSTSTIYNVVIPTFRLSAPFAIN